MVDQVLVGTGRGLPLDDLRKVRLGSRLLRGVRLVQTHLYNEPLSQEDLTDLALYRLDLLAAIGIGEDGLPLEMHVAHLLPHNSEKEVYRMLSPTPFHAFQLESKGFVEALEREMARGTAHHEVQHGQESAILISASKQDRGTQEERLEELAELVRSADGIVLERVVQRVQDGHHKFLLGSGKLKDVVIKGLQRGANLLVFDQNLTPAQIRAISEVTEMKVIDRTQMILDIFARRAHSREGKVQVELAQLKYLLPRLSGRHPALSRLGGGIGGRGPGETKLESDRRRVRDRIVHLEKELASLARHQGQRRARRLRHMVPIFSIVGYTNAGKSTLLNVLTESHVPAQDRPFETLDTSSRRLRFPREREVIITDTVGFMRDLPRELMGAFRSTLEELRDADLLLHLVDATANDFEGQIKAVEGVLTDLNLNGIPRVLVFNKCEGLASEEVEALCRRFDAIGISALRPWTLAPLIARLEEFAANLSRSVISGTESTDRSASTSQRGVGVL